MSQITTPSSPLGPFKLVTCNRHKHIAQDIMGQTVRSLSEEFTIIHTANADSLENLGPILEQIKPDILGIASSWKPNESAAIQAAAIRMRPSLRTFVVPHDILAEEGPGAVMEFCRNALTSCIKSIDGPVSGDRARQE